MSDLLVVDGESQTLVANPHYTILLTFLQKNSPYFGEKTPLKLGCQGISFDSISTQAVSTYAISTFGISDQLKFQPIILSIVRKLTCLKVTDCHLPLIALCFRMVIFQLSMAKLLDGQII